MGSSHSTHTGAQGNLGHRVGQWAATTNQGAMQFAAGLHAAAETTTALHQGAAHLAQAAGPAIDTLRLAMANVQRAKHGGAYGGDDGGGGYFGGDDTADPAKGLREYEASLSAQAKEDVIRRLARALSRVGIAVNPEGDLDEIVRGLVSQIPNPRTNKKTFSDEAAAQEKICRLVADVLNDEFTPGETAPSAKFIDTSLSPVAVCRAVGEWAHSFAAGVNTEFLAVHASVRNALRAIEVTAEIMREAHDKIRRQADLEGDPAFSRKFEPLNEIYNRAQVERRRQEELLKNLLHVHLAPAAKELELAMQDESEQNALIKRLGLKPGTSEFADSLAMALSGLGTTASIAHRVHRALKQVGLSVRQYLESAEYADFQRLLDARLESGAIKAEDLAEFLTAIDTLRYNFAERGEARFREALEAPDVLGGVDEEFKSTVVKRAERQESEKKIILRDFAGRMSRHYDELLGAVKSLGPELGKTIPLSDRTDALRDALVRLKDMRAERIEFSLIGLYMDASARAKKEQFVNALRLVLRACTGLMELDMYRAAGSRLARLKAAIEGIEKTIDYFADVVVKKYGGEGEDKDEGAAYGGARGGDDTVLSEIARSALSLSEAVNEFAYFYYVAKVRGNLAQTSAELEAYGEKYLEALGDAVAARLHALEQAQAAVLNRLTPANRAAGQPLNAIFGLPGANAGTDAWFDKTREWVKAEFAVKTRFYRALQAVDLYLKAFTAGIVKDPDATRDIKKMLDGTQVIARWFSEHTGDHIWKAFERMPETNFANAKVVAAANRLQVAAAPAGGAQHYYEQLAGLDAATTAQHVGVPELGVNAGNVAPNDVADGVKKSVAEALEYFQALKNLVNAFARTGDKFGGRELRTQVFMSPTQIYKALMDYMKQSALSINAGGAAAPPQIPLPAQRAGALDALAQVRVGVDRYQVYFGAVGLAGLGGNFEIEDRYFSLIIKGMAAKVLTTLGVYDMFERASPIYDLTPTRMIVGGGFEGDPEVLEGAAELYFRLPRLAEFYRMFKWDGETPADPYKIAMLPELEGIFSGLIRLVFQKMASPESGDYSDSELRAVIHEINAIYAHFREKSGAQACQDALSAFVMEVNRRYGVIKADDMKAYWKMVRLARTGDYGSYNNTSYAILPGEDEADIDRRAPSDRFAAGAYPRYDPATGRPLDPATGLPYEPFANLDRTLDTDWAAGGRRQMLRDFRRSLEAEFEKVSRADFRKTSFTLLISQAAAEIGRSASSEAKLGVAFKLIQGTSVVSTDANKAYMFHETVVVGLNTLSAIETMLRQFSGLIDAMNPLALENELMDRLYEAGLTNANVPNAQLLTLDALFQRPMAAGHGVNSETPARPAGYYSRYLIDTAAAPSYYGRSGLALNATPADLDAFFTAEQAHYLNQAAHLPPKRPSTYTGANPIAGTQIPGEAPGNNWTANQIQGLRALRITARFVVNYNQIMRDYVENVFDLMGTFQGLVEVRFVAGGGIQFGFSKLRGVAESLLADVKYFLDLFRPFIPKPVIDRYESLNNAGSVYWLEQHLVDRFFRGSFQGDPASQRVGEAATLDGLGRRASDVLRALSRETFVSTESLTNANLNGGQGVVEAAIVGLGAAWPDQTAAAKASRREDYGQAFSGLVFYDAVSSTSGLGGLAQNGGIAGDFDLGALIMTARGGAAPAAAGGALLRWNIYTSANTLTQYRSLMMAFNQLLARYLNTLVDTTGGQRVYLNLINSLANGVMSRAVNDPAGNSWPDLATVGAPFGMRGDPKPTATLFQSLGYVLQRLMKDTMPPLNQVSEHLVTTLTDVPLYMKETYRANLPGFVKLFDFLSQKCDFIKQFIQKGGFSMVRPSQLLVAQALNAVAVAGPVQVIDTVGTALAPAAPANANAYQAGSLGGLENLDAGQSDAGMKARLAAVIDAVASGAYTLSNAAAEVLKELGDNPVYLQTQEGSIETYKMRYGKLPLMPLSLSMWYLGDLTMAGGYVADARLYPRHTLGSPEFKLLYGHRQLLARSTPVGFEQLPSVKASLEAYNGISSQRERIDEARYLAFVQNVVGVLRYTIDCRNYKSLLASTSRLFCSGSLLQAVAAAAPAPSNGIVVFADGPAIAVFPLIDPQKDAHAILNVVEDSNQEEEAEQITAVVGAGIGAGAGVGDRALERVLNLIDMNIIPVNVHALMRDIPLANLYNYEYTFEQMVASLYGEPASRYTQVGGLPDPDTKSTRQMLLRLLVNPYMEVSTGMYGSDVQDLGSTGFVHRIFRGDNNLGMGRPKFLSDQLFNKALFGSVYQSRSDYDEGGPGVGAGVSRGAANAVGPAEQALRELLPLYNRMVAVNAAIRTAIPQANMGGDPNVAAVNAALAVGQARPVRTATAALAAAANAPALLASIDAQLIPYYGELHDIANAGGALLARASQWLRDAAVTSGNILAVVTRLRAAERFSASLAAIDALVPGPWAGAGTAARTIGARYSRDLDRLLDELDAAAVPAGTAGLLRAQVTPGGLPNALYSIAQAEMLAARRLPATNVRHAQSGPRASKLTFLKAPEAMAAGMVDADAVHEVDFGDPLNKMRLELVGKLRFDTRFIRKLFYITNVVRLLRLKLNRELTQSRGVLVSSHVAVSAGVTEYGSDPFTPNESDNSYINDGFDPSGARRGLRRFNDADPIPF